MTTDIPQTFGDATLVNSLILREKNDLFDIFQSISY